MNSSKIRLVACEPDFNDKLEAVYNRITERAYEKWLVRNAVRKCATEMWSVAETELLVQPAAEVREWAHGVTIRLQCANLDPDKVRVFITPSRMLILAPLPTPGDKWLFRLVDFKTPVDTGDASATYGDGVLEFSATSAGAADDHKVHFMVA